MVLVDVSIVLVIVLAMLSGFREGFFRSFCATGGLLLGLLLAAWNYERGARLLLPLVRLRPVAEAIGFLAIAVFVMAAAAFAGKFLSRALHYMGLSFLDRLAGGIFGFFKGALMVTLVVLVAVAFFPKAHWLIKARLPRLFFGACHLSTHMSPAELAARVRHGFKILEEESPHWLHSGNNAL
jgi:membrane protein required for colicin V production